MPIKIDGKMFESDQNMSAFEKAVQHLMKAKGLSRKSAQAIVGSIEKKMKNAMAFDNIPELWSEGGKNYAKFFLINPEWNQQNWRVTSASIPEHLHTFEGMPYIEEPKAEHFGMNEDSPVSWILENQDKFKLGTIVKTKWNAASATGEAIVEFDDTSKGRKAFESLRNGEMIYVSPAITGIANFDQYNRMTYDLWHGLHLARVKNPAYGVRVASIKETCTGPGSTCINRMFKSAVANGKVPSSSFNSEEQIQDMTEAEIKELKEQVQKLTGDVTKLTGDNQKLVSTNSELEAKLKSASATGTDEATKKLIETLNQKVANAENKNKEEFAVALADGEVSAGLIEKTTHKERVAEYMKLDLDSLTKTFNEKKPLIEKIISLQTKPSGNLFAPGEKKTINLPEVAATASSPIDEDKITSAEQLEGLF